MIRYMLKRLGLAILTLLIILVFAYVMIFLFADTPYDKQLLKPGLKQHEIAAIQNKINQYRETPLHVAFWGYVKSFFDKEHPFGVIYNETANYKTIPELFFYPIRWTILVSLPGFILSSILGTILGIFAGYKRGTIWDTIINIFILIFIAVPSFIMAPIILNISRRIGFDIIFRYPQDVGSSWGKTILSLIPAIVTITLSSLAVYTMYARNQVVTVLTSNYILIAKAKGLSKTSVFFKYVFRNISIPLSAIILPSYIGLLSGSLIIETFWGIQGTSTVIVQAFPNAEINIVMFNIFFFTSLSLFTDILVDVSYVLIDPRIKYQASSGINIFTILKAKKYRKQQYKELQAQKLTMEGGK